MNYSEGEMSSTSKYNHTQVVIYSLLLDFRNFFQRWSIYKLFSQLFRDRPIPMVATCMYGLDIWQLLSYIEIILMLLPHNHIITVNIIRLIFIYPNILCWGIRLYI